MGVQNGKDVFWEEKPENMEERERIGKFRDEEMEDEKASMREKQSRAGRGKRGKKANRLTGSMAAKITVFFLLVLFVFVGTGAAALSLHMESEGVYTRSLNDTLANSLYGESMEIVYTAKYYLSLGNTEAAEALCRDINIDIDMIWVDESGRGEVLWGTWSGYDTKITVDLFSSFDDLSRSVTLNGHQLKEDETYLYRVYVDPNFPEDDVFRRLAGVITVLYEYRFTVVGLAVGGTLLAAFCFVFLMCSAGHRNGREGIVPGVLTGIHLDVLTCIFGIGAAISMFLFVENFWINHWSLILLLAVGGTLEAVWTTVYCMELALRLKMGKCWRHTLIYLVLRGLWKLFRALGRGMAALVRGIPLIFVTLTAYFGICFLEFIGVAIFMRNAEGVLLWAFEKVVLLVVVAYIALVCRELLEASRALAEGQEGYVVDTSKMFGDFREHGENLNSLGQGISKAVAERMKSERLKTELISNVSHDLKTPLTSIINYAGLIYEEASGTGRELSGQMTRSFEGEETNATDTFSSEAEDGEAVSGNVRMAEYAEVLLRQSRRLKKLLEDLMEASKATTGNLEVNLESCEVGVLLSQAVGEYQQRMEEKGLDLIARQPEEPVRIMADGKHLWRIFDNLLNNVCKYAQENSRVYLNLEKRDGNALIIFRNMSKYALDISAEELEERFVRGDKSRHMEGNGLGLSIAKSLVDLQDGRMELIIDGDLFKVTLRFPLFQGE